MLISFDNRKIRKICEDEIEAQNEFGIQVSIKLQNRLADLAAAKSVTDIIIGNPCEIENTPYPNYKVDLCNNYILIFTVNNIIIPQLEDGSINWSEVNRIKILEIIEKP
ncbi:hypothetical protein [Flavobacterium sp. TBRC 19031]|uniref:hypothetical protein n=1 Tax=Flavobacterium mekongense TaxID=3379707 RepID=UPI00399AE775